MSHKKYRSETNCLNCGAEVAGKFCSICGQENVEIHENFFHLAGHFISDYFHFDSKFFRSLIPLFTRPGFLTKEYWQGRRIHYIHPLRLFFFITIIFMISTTVFYKQFGSEMKGRMMREIATDDVQLSTLDEPQKEQKLKEQKAGNERRMKKLAAGIDDFFGYIKYITFFLLPVYALIFKILYRRRRDFYVDHLVYTMHLQSFLYCLFGVLLLLPFIFPFILEFLLPAALLLLFIYVGISLQFLYQQVWWKTLLKSLIATSSLFMITIFVMVLYAFFDAIFFK